MAYQLKTIRFQGHECRILLQNENGPCPLLAAANCLLLQDRVSLPATAIRNNVASLSDLTNVLANFALSQHENSNNTMMNDDSEQDIMRAQSHYQLNELLQLIPKLQDGMDVNPKFTAGITGYEYTSQLTCFDLWKVQLVHGWLLEKNTSSVVDNTDSYSVAAPDGGDNHSDDHDFYEAIRDKTYNELVEMVIRGHDARDKVQEIQAQLNELQQQAQAPSAVPTSAALAPPDLLSGDDGATTESAVPLEKAGPAPPDLLSGDIVSEVDTAASFLVQEQQKEQEDQKARVQVMMMIQELKDKLAIYQSAASMSARVDDFLQATSHQLTHYGLQALHTDLQPNQVAVFFRNNHFSTLIKNVSDGHLYLLVTDLGYCNTPLVVWEKLDDIFGNTEYVNSDFCKPDGAATTTESGVATSLSPEQLLAQSSQNDADYHLALHLSKQEQQGSGSSTAGLDAQEGQLLAAATEASLREYHGLSSNVVTTAIIPPGVEVGIHVSPPAPFTGGGGTIVALPPAPASGNNSQLTTAAMTQESADMLLAMELAASDGASNQSSVHYSNDADASYHLARQLQEEENQQAAARRQAQASQRQQQQQAAATSATMANRNRAAATTSSSSSSNANCTIS